MRLWQSGAELNSTTTDVEVSTNSGTVSISSTTVRSGTYAWRANPSSSTGFFRQVIHTSNQNTQVFARVYVYISTLPSANMRLLSFANVSNGPLARIDLTTTGTLQLRNNNNVQVGSDSSALSTGQWYMIELMMDATSSPGSIAGKLDGTLFASGANSSQGSWARFLWGVINPSTTANLFFDDVAINDSSGSFQNTYPGEGKIIHLRPNAVGDNSDWFVGTGSADDYTYVDEVTPNDNSSSNFIGSGTSGQIDDFNIEASGLTSETINVVMVGIRASGTNSPTNKAIRVRAKASAGGTVEASASDVQPNSNSFFTNQQSEPRSYPLIMYDLPGASTTAWTPSDLDTAQIGVECVNGTGSANVLVSTIWMSVEFSSASGSNYSSTLTDTVTISEVFSKSLFIIKSETATIVSTILKSLNRLRLDTFSLSELFTKVLPSKLITNTLSFSESFSKSINKNRSESVSLTSVITRIIYKPISLSVTMAEDFQALKLVFLNLSDSFSLSSIISKYLQRSRTESLTISDNISKFLDKKSYNESVTILDSIIKSHGQYRTYNESVSVLDSLTKTIQRITSDLVSPISTISRYIDRKLTDAITVASLVEFMGDNSLDFTETFVANDFLSKSLSMYRSDIATIVEQFNVRSAFARIFSDSSSFSESIVKIVSRYKQFIDLVNTTDSFAKQVQKSNLDTVYFAESILRYLNGIFIINTLKSKFIDIRRRIVNNFDDSPKNAIGSNFNDSTKSQLNSSFTDSNDSNITNNFTKIENQNTNSKFKDLINEL